MIQKPIHDLSAHELQRRVLDLRGRKRAMMLLDLDPACYGAVLALPGIAPYLDAYQLERRRAITDDAAFLEWWLEDQFEMPTALTDLQRRNARGAAIDMSAVADYFDTSLLFVKGKLCEARHEAGLAMAEWSGSEARS